MKNKKRIIFVLVTFMLVLLVTYIIFRGNYLEKLELGEQYVGVFWQNLKYMSITLIVNFIFVYLVFYIANKLIKFGLKDFFAKDNKEMPRLMNKSISFVIAILISAISSNIILEKALLFFNSSQFGKIDPIFNQDIGYFIFQKPFIEFILVYLMIILFAVIVYAFIYYIICFNRFLDGVDIKNLKTTRPVKQLIKAIFLFSVLLAIFVLFKTQNIELERFVTLEEGTSSYSLYGAGLADVTIKLWGYRFLSFIMVISVFIAAKAYTKRKN